MKVTFPYNPVNEDELKLETGDVIEVLHDVRKLFFVVDYMYYNMHIYPIFISPNKFTCIIFDVGSCEFCLVLLYTKFLYMQMYDLMWCFI